MFLDTFKEHFKVCLEVLACIACVVVPVALAVVYQNPWFYALYIVTTPLAITIDEVGI